MASRILAVWSLISCAGDFGFLSVPNNRIFSLSLLWFSSASPGKCWDSFISQLFLSTSLQLLKSKTSQDSPPKTSVRRTDSIRMRYGLSHVGRYQHFLLSDTIKYTFAESCRLYNVTMQKHIHINFHICTVHPAVIKVFFHCQLMYKRIVFRGVLKFTWKLQ